MWQPGALLAIALLMALSVAARADEVDDRVRGLMSSQQIPGLSLAVVREGKVVKAAGYGNANVELDVPATAETVYQIQSVTKQFTATAVMMLVEEGKVGLDEKVSHYLDGTPASWSGITVRHLLTHTSGIKDFINEATADLRLDVSEEDVLKATAPRPLNFQPGERYAYSNTNYHLLAMIVRKVTGKSWGDFVVERICGPLGMKDTRVISWTEIIPHRAAGYVWNQYRLRNGSYVAESILGYAGGGLRSTVLDMAKWDAALYTEKLLHRASLEKMWTGAKLNNGQTSGYGFGWGVGALNGHRMLSHTGGHITGFSTVITRFPDDKLTVIVLTNQTGLASPSSIAQKVAALYIPALAVQEAKAIEDKDPKATAFFTRVVRDGAAGKLDRGLFTPDFSAAVSDQRMQDAARMLQALGELKSLEPLERREEGGRRIYRYRAIFERGKLVIVGMLSADDKLAGMDMDQQ